MTESPVLTFREACAYLKRGSTWLKGHADEIGAIRDGGRIAFLKSDLDAWFTRHRATPKTEAAPTPITAPRQVRQHDSPLNPVTRLPWGVLPAPAAAPATRRGRAK